MTRCIVVNEFVDKSVEPPARRLIGSTIDVDDEARVERWTAQQLVHPVDGPHNREWPWGTHDGRDLTYVDEPLAQWRSIVVACLNVWNDRPALEQTAPLWIADVDRVIAVDGAYAGVHVTHGASSDGTLDYLRSLCAAWDTPLHIIECGDVFWHDQCMKRNAYLGAAREDELLFIVDADEFVDGAECLRVNARKYDVGWVRLHPREVYAREYDTPRVIRYHVGMHYTQRHHWIETRDGRLVTTHQYGGVGFDHTVLPITLDHAKGLGRTHARNAATRSMRQQQLAREREYVRARSDTHTRAREALRIVHLTQYDPGNVVYRLHSAINATTPHSSIYARTITEPGDPRDGGNNPFETPYQYEMQRDRALLRMAVKDADIVHCHLGYYGLHTLGVERRGRPLVIHHHGTMYRESADARNEQDAREGAGLRLVSNFELLKYGDALEYLPNPVPVAQYRRMREAIPHVKKWPASGTLRVAHAPSKRALKGTDAFMEACSLLQARGLHVVPVLIEHTTHDEALRIKATCDVCFDSFWLGMQCSGIEAAAMGMPVIAGDAECRAIAEARYEHCPWTFADDIASLLHWLRVFYTNPNAFALERERVVQHVEQYHDFAAVTMRYFDLLDERFEWREKLTVGTFVDGGWLT